MKLHRPDATRCLRRHRLRRFGACALLVVGALGIAGTANAGNNERPGIQVVQVKGLLDAPNVSLLRDTIEEANEKQRTALIVQLDSRGAIADVLPVVRAINRSRVPIAVWVGPSGAEAKGGAALLAEAAHALFIANGSTIGPAYPVRLDDTDRQSIARVRAELVVTVGARGRGAEVAQRITSGEVSAKTATRVGLVDGSRPTVGETIVKLDGKTVETADGEHELSTATVIGEGRDRRRQPNQEVVFATLGLGGQVQHSLINPSIAYFLFVIGLALIVFEFFAASVGFAAAVGAISVIGALYGFSHLPVRWWAVALLLLSAFGFAVDAQAGGLGFWTGVGVLTLLGGSFALYGGSSDLHPAWWALAVVLGTVIVFYVFAIPAFIRARFSTPTVGREGMLGELGTAEVDVAPDGVVLIRDARWRARTNRATPINAGDSVRVIAIEGVVLEVEPEAGGARDYRERGRRKKGGAEPEAAETSEQS